MPRLVYSANYLIEANKANIVPQVVGMVEISSGGFAPGTITAHATFPLPSPYNYDGRLRDVSSIDCSLNGAYGRVSFAITNADLGEVANVAADKYVGWECKVHKIIILEDGTLLGILLLHGVITSYTMTDRVVDMDVVTRINVGNTITPRRVNVKCPWVFKGTECGYSGVLTTCNKLYNDADGCSGRSNQHRFGGFPLRLPEASIGAVSGQGGAPTYQLIRDDSAFQFQRAILEFDNTFSVTDDPTNNKTVISVTGGGGGGSGTVTSVALTAPSFLTVTGSPVTTSGTLALALATQNANTVFAGPITGIAADPTFRALGLTDLPQIATNRLLGRVTASTGPVEEITPGAGVLAFIQTPSSSSFANAIADGTGSGVAVFDTSPTLTTPRIADIRSSTNRSFLTFVQNGSSVNYFQIGNSVAAGPSSLSGPTIETVGTSTDINFAIKSKGAGNVNISPGGQVNIQNLSSTLPGVLVLQNGTLGGAEIGIGAITIAASLSGSGYYTLPLSDGTSGQALSTNGSGALSWASYQPLDADLTAIAALTANGLLRKTGGTWAMDSASYLTANQTITLSGDATGSGATSIAVTLANSGVSSGTYRSVTVDAKGRVTAGTNPTTLSGYGITDAQPLDADLTAIAALTGDGLLRKTGGTWAMDSASYLTANQTITLSGDVTGSGATAITTTIANNAVTTTKILNKAVTLAKLDDIASDRLLGRDSPSTGGVEQITVGGGIEFTSSGGIQTTALTGDVTKTAGGTSTTIANDAVITAKILDGAVTPAKLSSVAQVLAFKNRIINGSMMIAQRGTSFTSTGGANNDDVYTLDRWTILSDGNDTIDVTQATDVPTGGLFSIGLDVETTNRKFGIIQFIEQRNCIGLIGNTVTLSFKARVTSTTKLDNVKCAILAWSGTADSLTSDVVSAWNAEGTNPTLIANWTYENTPANMNVTTSWASYSVSAAVDTSGTKNIAVFIWSDVTDTTLGDFLYITDVQLERGSTATEFERLDIATQLMQCQRYFQILRGSQSSNNILMVGLGYAQGVDSARAWWTLPTLMRTSGTATINSAAANFNDFTFFVNGVGYQNFATMTIDGITTFGFSVYSTFSANQFTVGNIALLNTYNQGTNSGSPNAFFSFNSEL